MGLGMVTAKRAASGGGHCSGTDTDQSSLYAHGTNFCLSTHPVGPRLACGLEHLWYGRNAADVVDALQGPSHEKLRARESCPCP